MSLSVAESLARPAPRVVFYGTSLTKSGGWAETIGCELQARFPGLHFTNAGCNGQHSRWGRDNFESLVLGAEPDLVFLEFAINDAVARFAITPAEARANLARMLDHLAIHRPHCAAVLQVMNPVVGRPAGHDGHRPELSAYEQVYREVGKERGLLVVDHRPAWMALLAGGEEEFRRFVPDGLHPNAQGYERCMLPALRRALGLAAC